MYGVYGVLGVLTFPSDFCKLAFDDDEKENTNTVRMKMHFKKLSFFIKVS